MLLEPYIKDHTATAAMQETYVNAIFKTSTYESVITAAKNLWSKQENMPITVQKMLAESYLRLGKSAEALNSYRLLAEERPQDQEVTANIAYTLVYSGQTFEGLGVYDQLLRKQPEMAGTFVEDAVALLSQGNILGGRSLFENIIALQPEKVAYRQRYAEVLRLYNITGPAQVQHQQLAKVQNISETQQRQQSHKQAIQLARKQQFPEALSTLRWLHETEHGDQSITFDYVTVLHWSGHQQEAIQLYEQLPSVQIPDYVRKNIADAYYNIGDYSKALATVRLLSDRDNRKNKLQEAELLMRLGDNYTGQAIYEQLLSLDPKDVDVYLRRAAVTASLNDYRQATWNLEQALRLIPQVPDNEMRIRQIKADLAIGYIKLRQSARAIPLLVPYINNKTATDSMQGNYINALKDMGKYRLTTTEAARIWPDYTKAPLFGLRAVAESYIKLKETSKAIGVYRQMVALAPDDVTDQNRLAFNLMLEGKLIQGLEVYNQLIMKDPKQAVVAVNDAISFLATTQYVVGKSLFELVVSRCPNDPLYRRQYADALAEKLSVSVSLSSV